MNFKKIGLVLVSAGLAAFAVGCGDGGTGGDGTCTSNANCATDEICHPVAKVCVHTCTAGSDCPDSAKTCDVIKGGTTASTDGGATGQKVCQCSTTPFCNDGNVGGSLVCNDEIRVCEVKCTTDTNCSSGRKCDTATGQCKAGTSSCTPACATGQVCVNSACVASCKVGGCGTQVCNTTTGQCEAPKTCSTGSAQPDTCGVGQFCSGTSCKDTSTASCANITAHGASWTPAKTGNIIYEITKTFCGATNPERAKVSVKAYSPTGGTAFPVEAGLPAILHYVKADGTEGSIATSVQDYTLSNSNKNLTFSLNFCLPTGSTTFSLALHFVDGNEQCAQIAHDYGTAQPRYQRSPAPAFAGAGLFCRERKAFTRF